MKKIAIIIFSFLVLFLICPLIVSAADSATSDNANPSNVQAAAVGTKDVKLTWTKNKDAVNYKIMRDGKAIGTITDINYNDKGVADGEHKYEIIAQKSGGVVISTSALTITKTATGLTVVNAAAPPIAKAPSIKDIEFPKSNFTDLKGLIQGVINWLLGFTGSFAVIAIVYSGIMYMTAGGDVAKADSAKKNLTWAIIGMVVVILSYVIVSQINKIFLR